MKTKTEKPQVICPSCKGDKKQFEHASDAPCPVCNGKGEIDATCTVQFEYTDTFGGEANYSWCKRHEETFPADITDRALVRRAKAWAGLTGIPCRVENYGDEIRLYPAGHCTVLFVSTVY